jgi:hypothetical protein
MQTENVIWDVRDVMELLKVSKPIAYRTMQESGCLLPLNRRKRVAAKHFMAYLTKEIKE